MQNSPIIPSSLLERFDFHWRNFCSQTSPEILNRVNAFISSQEKFRQLQICWIGSEFAAELSIKSPQWLLDLLQEDLIPDKNFKYYQQALKKQLENTANEEDLMCHLRNFRNHSMLRIIWRDFNRIADTQQTINELSHLADVCIQQATNFCYQQLCERHGTPRDEHGIAQHLLVLGMGKLGAHELNLSSDIDLIFAYPEEGSTDHRIEPTSNHQFFIKLGQKLMTVLGKITAEGFVFRVDMALRPHGASGPLACSFATMENYYQEQGRSWERYAMIKARVVAGEESDANELISILRPFTYRRYIDFSVVESLREMKALINREVKRRGYKDNVKLGAGGIREIEFIVQATQLIRGGRELEFQQREILPLFELLAEKNLLSHEIKTKLKKAYLFLRDTEHVLQGYKDEQTQQLPPPPTDKDEPAHQRIGFLMGFNSWGDFISALNMHRGLAASLFNEFASFDESPDQANEGLNKTVKKLFVPEWVISLWESTTLEEKHLLLQKNCVNYELVSSLAECLQNFQNEKRVKQIQGDGKDRLHVFMPYLLLQVLALPNDPAESLGRIFPLILAILRRSAYLVLLNENHQAIRQLVTLSTASPWIADQLAAHPVLLDELLDERSLYHIPTKEELADALRQEMLRIPLSDLEGQMEALRYFKLARRLHIAACEVTGRLPLMKVSDYLTWLAEVILNHALHVAWCDLTERYGFPVKKDGSVCDPAFVVVGYGKLGGLELSHNSDLDVVFIHGADPLGYTTGCPGAADKGIDNATFYARLGQRLIHMMETRTHGGQLYEIDTQLRPSGNSGLLVTSLEAFEKYQQESAWVWEHQALVRARVVAGCQELAKQFDRIRAEVLSRKRDQQKLKEEIINMREKMVQHLSSKSPTLPEALFDLKQDRGGIIDIEFIVQYAVLAWADQEPALLRWTDNIRILEELAKARLLSADEAQKLIEVYKTLRCLGHQLALQNKSTKTNREPFDKEIEFVTVLWKKILA